VRGLARVARCSLPFAVLFLVAGCSIPSWVPLVGRSKATPNLPAEVATPEKPKSAPLLPGASNSRRAPVAQEVLDRVVCVVNNDAITQYEIDEAEAYHYYESKQPPAEGTARETLRRELLDRIIENRLQLQQAEREKVTVEEAEIEEQLGEIRKRLSVQNDVQLEEALRPQGVSLEAVKRRVRETLMVQRMLRRKVALRISVTEQEIDRYLAQNRDKLESSLSFSARHILLLPESGGGDEGWQAARARADEVYARLLAGDDFGDLARKYSDDATGKDGGALGALKRGELAPEIEAEILKLKPGEASAPFRSEVGYHLFKLESRDTLTGEELANARNQIRDILFREKYQARLKDWLAEIRQRAMIDMRL